VKTRWPSQIALEVPFRHTLEEHRLRGCGEEHEAGENIFYWSVLVIHFLPRIKQRKILDRNGMKSLVIFPEVLGLSNVLLVARAATLTIIVLRPFARIDEHAAGPIVIVLAFVLW
jgi:hypothetical protein